MATHDPRNGSDTPPSHHVPLEETLAQAAARIADHDRSKGSHPGTAADRPPMARGAEHPRPATDRNGARGATHGADHPPSATSPRGAAAAGRPTFARGADHEHAAAPPEGTPARRPAVTRGAEHAHRPASPGSVPARRRTTADGASSAAPLNPTPAATSRRLAQTAAKAPRGEFRWRPLIVAATVTGIGVTALIWGLRPGHDPALVTTAAMPKSPDVVTTSRPAPIGRQAGAPNTRPTPPAVAATSAPDAAGPGISVDEAAPGRIAVVVNGRTAQSAREYVHTVRPGETLWSIAERYIHDPWAYTELAARSGITNPNLIHPGEQVTIVFQDRPTP